MPTASQTILKRIQSTLGGVSAYRAAKELGVTQQAVSHWKTGRSSMQDAAALKAAAILGEQPEVIFALLGAERSQDPDARKVWTNLARRLQRSAATGIVTALGIAAFLSSQGIDAATSTARGMYIMSNDDGAPQSANQGCRVSHLLAPCQQSGDRLFAYIQ
jgi:plasmid maintenance system antidote protein VapI